MIAPDDFGMLLYQASDSADLGEILSKNNYSKAISNIVLTKHAFNKLRLKGLSFVECQFDSSHFSGGKLMNCHFQKCTFKNTALVGARLQKCKFTKCDFNEAMFVNTELDAVHFERCNLHFCSFEDATLIKSLFSNVTMSGTHFLDATVNLTSIRQSDLTDALFFGNKRFDIDQASHETCQVLRPTTVTLLAPEARGVSGPFIVKRLYEIAHTIPVRINARPQKTAKDMLAKEMAECLAKATSTAMPIPQQVVHSIRENPRGYAAASAILEKAARLAKYVDSIVLPGGEDMAPELYGAYFGARLYQHIGSEQIGVQILTSDAPNSIYGNMFKNIHTAVCHHQAIRSDSDMDQLRPSISHVVQDAVGAQRKVTMAVEPIHSGVPMVGIQFHTEFFQLNELNASAPTNDDLKKLARSLVLDTSTDLVKSDILRYMSGNNPKFWELVASMASVYRSKRFITPSGLQAAKEGLSRAQN